MRKVLFILLMAFTMSMSAVTVDLNKKWGAVIEAIAQVESEGDCSKVSKCGRYVGYLQISEILVRECNAIAGTNKYTYKDRYDKQKSISMFIDFMERHNPEGNYEKAIRLWNSGDKKCMVRKRRTEGYYRRVMSKFSQQAKN